MIQNHASRPPVPEVNRIISSVQRMYNQDSPPPERVLVYPDTVKRLEEPDTYKATVKIVVKWCGEKSHKVHIKFRTKNSEIIPSTLSYISYEPKEKVHHSC